MNKPTTFVLFVVLTISCFAALAQAQPMDTNYDEAMVPQYTLPDPLVAADGTRVVDAESWYQGRRPELLKLFETHVYGRSPAALRRDGGPDQHFVSPLVLRKLQEVQRP